MTREAPPFRADHVGSLLRPPALITAREDFMKGRIDATRLRAREDEAEPVERPPLGARFVGDEDRDANNADEADRNIDEEDPTPLVIGYDETTKRGPKHGTQHCRNRQVCHRVDQPRLWYDPQHHQSPDRDHHRAAQALENSGEHERE